MIRVWVWVWFTCLQKYHYNKAPLYLVSHGHILEEEQPLTLPTDLEELGHLWWISSGECTHIRSKTNDHDNSEKMQETAKATFQGRQAQSNFRNYFAANNYSVFSRKHFFPTYQNFPTISLSLDQEKTKLYLCQMFLAKDKWNLKCFL